MAVAGSIDTTVTRKGPITKYVMDWLCDASGDVTEVATSVKQGYIIAVKFTPDAGGTQPTALYDVTLQDTIVANTLVDYLAGLGANLSQSVSSIGMPLLSSYGGPIWWEGGNLYLTVDNAGAAKGGIVTIWVRDG
jgi:hypothetical protein